MAGGQFNGISTGTTTSISSKDLLKRALQANAGKKYMSRLPALFDLLQHFLPAASVIARMPALEQELWPSDEMHWA